MHFNLSSAHARQLKIIAGGSKMGGVKLRNPELLDGLRHNYVRILRAQAQGYEIHWLAADTTEPSENTRLFSDNPAAKVGKLNTPTGLDRTSLRRPKTAVFKGKRARLVARQFSVLQT